MRKKSHTFDEVNFRGQQICLEAVSIREWVPEKPATWEQPKEGGYWEVIEVYATAFEREVGGELVTVERTKANWGDSMWIELDELAANRVEPLTLN